MSTMQNMKIMLNGADHDCTSPASVSDLLQQLELADKRVAVEVNKAIVRRAQHAEHQLQAGDQVEVVTLVGGG